jgi:hypothetical protein
MIKKKVLNHAVLQNRFKTRDPELNSAMLYLGLGLGFIAGIVLGMAIMYLKTGVKGW